jgi:RNA polymerase sigma-70 factor (ECF subfamily)
MDPFDEVYGRYGERLHAYLARLTGDPWTADELCQETFVRYLDHPPRSAVDGQVGAWLFRVATNLGLDRLRRREPRVLVGEPEADAPAPEEETASRDLDARIRAEIARLPPKFRAAFLLRANHELPFRDVGRALGITERAAKHRFRRARDQLLARLGGAGEGGVDELR